ncbi:transposase [Nonomuraea sp. NPDC050451]|uniref:IS110 family transposase n=1 Tax=Nonomuraea sp. NPDC050451 TaxID=3364364 RepID=UPI00379D7C4C
MEFARQHVPGRRCWALEGAGSYGAGLAAFLEASGEKVVEVCRPKRPAQRGGRKTDALDAIRAAHEALTSEHLIQPRQRGEREAFRVLLTTRQSAVSATTAAINHLKALIVSAPDDLTEAAHAAGFADAAHLTRVVRRTMGQAPSTLTAGVRWLKASSSSSFGRAGSYPPLCRCGNGSRMAGPISCAKYGLEVPVGGGGPTPMITGVTREPAA